jgi:alkanesulfonate monooxygenase SsuD/methylene tetrahydromethanopterin reductase-like flavin-dependent oxidoreductase (luciferase family)
MVRSAAPSAERAGAEALVVSHPVLDPIPFAALAAALTRTIRIGVHVRLEAAHPFVLARALTTLDHLSSGRVALVPDSTGLSDAQAAEYLAAVDSLWQSWDPAAEIQDEESGLFADPALVKPAHFDGEHYRSRGPLNLPHAPSATLAVWESERGALAGRADSRLPHDTVLRLSAGDIAVPVAALDGVLR